MKNNYITWWHPQDPSWLKERKSRWLRYKKAIKGLDFIAKKDHKYLREFFLTGEMSDDYCLPITNGQRHEGVNAIGLYYLFFSPIADVKSLREIMLVEAKSGYSFETLHAVHQYSLSSHFDTEVGMLDGREELLIKVIYGESLKEHRVFLLNFYENNHPQLQPGAVAGFFQTGCLSYFAENGDCNTVGVPRYSPIHWLVDHWYEDLMQYPKEKLEANQVSIKMFLNAVANENYTVLYDEERFNALRDRLWKILESGELPDIYTNNWKLAKQGKLDPFD